MQHRIPLDSLPPGGRAMARAVETCVHCGFCLPSCPTYRVLGEEMDSPRGRIVLMKQVLEGELAAQDVMPYSIGASDVSAASVVPVRRALSRSAGAVPRQS